MSITGCSTDGASGSGKTVTLLQLATHFHEQGWITIYVPNGELFWLLARYSAN
jgi:KaiC/GvpD/RAD55 family RecA-like ATPase